ncbi:MAG TPA: hypothetical protein VNO30_36085 [Kofleriaceae bacterium]|nr:hypothetical protein [Kofleriaceae bacterium]
MTPAFDIPDVVQQGFAFRAALVPGGLLVRLTGSADARATAELHAYVRHLHGEARRLDVSEVVVDLRSCTFMNSSCFKAILSWLSAISELAPGAQYRLRFTWDASSYWQRRGLAALKAYAVDLVLL